MGRISRFSWAGAVVATLALVAAACSSSSASPASGSTTTTTTTSSSTGTPLPTASPVAPGPVTLEVTKTNVGPAITDGEGNALYVFLPDVLGDPACVDQCVQTWLPVYVTGTPKIGKGVDASAVGTMKRDGNEQLTLGDQPAYYFAGDTSPGDTNGQGFDHLWYMVAPDGTRITGT